MFKCLYIWMISVLGTWCLTMNLIQTITTILASLLTLISGPTTYTEGLVGQPQNIHPLFSQENQIDQDLVSLIFEGLTRVDKNSQIVPALAESWEISEDKKIYTFKLSPKARFHNEQPVTTQDIIYTFQKSPPLKDIKTEELDPQTIKLTLDTPFSPFLHLLTIGIIPKHLDNKMRPLHPIGAGSYQISEIGRGTRKVETIILTKFKKERPGPERIALKFFETEKDLEAAAKLGEIDGFTSPNPAPKNFASQKTALGGRYFSLIFNLEGKGPLRDTEFRKTLAGLTNRKRVISDILDGNGTPIYGPLQNTWAQAKINPIDYNPEPRKFWEGELRLTFPDTKMHSQTADILQSDWEKSGITVIAEAASPHQIKNEILPQKSFDVVLIGQEVGRDPDRYTLWHSTQSESGQNFAGYKNMRADRALEEGRKEHDVEKRKEHYQNFQTIFTEDLPAIFLYQPTCTYHLKKTKDRGLNLEGIFVPSERWERIRAMYP